MKNASLRLGTVLFVLLGLVLAAILGFMLYPDEVAVSASFAAYGGMPALSTVSMPDGDINVNTASKEILMQLPGVGEVIAMEILLEREAHGLFRYPEDLLSVKGIGEKKLADMLPHIRLDDKP